MNKNVQNRAVLVVYMSVPEGEDMFNRTANGDESLVHYYESKLKCASLQWKHLS